jgi:hypothetical protein
MDPVYLMFSALLLLCAGFCFWSALQEYGDRMRWLTPAYTVLGSVEVIGAVALVAWKMV